MNEMSAAQAHPSGDLTPRVATYNPPLAALSHHSAEVGGR